MTYTWPSLAELNSAVTCPAGLTLGWLTKLDIEPLVGNLRQWYPDIVIGSESCHLTADFYRNECALGPEPRFDRDVLPLVLKRDDSIVWFITLEKEMGGKTLTARMGAIDPRERGAGLAMLGPQILEACARVGGFGLAYYFATLKIPHQQVCAERSGFSLVGIIPAFDLDMVRPGEPRRVFEALYAKVLVSSEQIEIPSMKNLTPKTKALYEMLFVTKPVE